MINKYYDLGLNNSYPKYKDREYLYMWKNIEIGKSELFYKGVAIEFTVEGTNRAEVLLHFCDTYKYRIVDSGLVESLKEDDFLVFEKPFRHLIEAKLYKDKNIKIRKANFKRMFSLSVNILERTLKYRAEEEKTTLPAGAISQDWLKEQESKSKEVAKDLDTDFSEFEEDPFVYDEPIEEPIIENTDDFEFTNDFDMDEDTDLNTNEPDSTEFEFEEPVLDDDNIPVLNDVKDDFEFEQDFFEDPVFEETKTKQDFSKLSVRNDILESRKESIEQKQSAAEIIFSTEYEEEFSRYYKFSIALIGDDYEAHTELHKEIEELIKTKYLYKVKRYKAIAELEKQGKSIEEIRLFFTMLKEYNKIIGK